MKVIVKNVRAPLDERTAAEVAKELHASLSEEFERNILGLSIIGVNKREPYTVESMAKMCASLRQRSLPRILPDRDELSEGAEDLAERKLLWISPSGELFPTYLPQQAFSKKPHHSEHTIPLPIPSQEEYAALGPEAKEAFRFGVCRAVLHLAEKGNILWVPASLPIEPAVANEYISRVREGIDAQLAHIEKTGGFTQEMMGGVRALVAVPLEIHRRNLLGEPVSPDQLGDFLAKERGFSREQIGQSLQSLSGYGFIVFAPNENDRDGKAAKTLCTKVFLLREPGSALVRMPDGNFMFLSRRKDLRAA